MIKDLDFAQKGSINIFRSFQSNNYANKFDVNKVYNNSNDIFLAASKNCINKSIIL